ncbi:hypothetical protein BC830DRAFT_1170121 [Chytriomyces sp. MP71]|nr:hypothetical protein BC830DRAFT_1170121 [Chytriomyces sp. MP71]
MGFPLAHVALQAALCLAVPYVSLDVWRVEFESPGDRHPDTPKPITEPVAKGVYHLFAAFLATPSNPQRWRTVDPRVRTVIVHYILFDLNRILKSGGIALVSDTLVATMFGSGRFGSQARAFLLAFYVLGLLVAAIPRFQLLYLTASTLLLGSAGGRTLTSTGAVPAHADAARFPGTGVRLSSSAPSGAGQNPVLAAAAARARATAAAASAKDEPAGPNYFGFGELRMNEETATVRRELEKKAPDTGLDAMLGMGLKVGVNGNGTGLSKFYGKGQVLGSSSGSGSPAVQPRQEENKKEVRGSYEKLD